VVASAVATAPWLAVVSRHKSLVFAISGSLLVVNYWLVVVRPRRCEPGESCHVDSPMMRWNRRIYWVSVGVYVTAVGVTYGGLWILSSF
jgi:hypothetical protein